ncbi:MAG TPA: CPBP family glutamic-type intramembrane protease [Candidatus Limnocylindria bacterium]|nr:CPBP family glutamic-type intramembrane protease [Candidatus Limnocylindria bacterium]
MLPREIEILILYALVGMLVLLRFDAGRFGAADYDDEEAPGGWRTWVRRMSWYLAGIVLIFLVFRLHDLPISELRLTIGLNFANSLVVGLIFGLLGTAVAFLYAWWRFGGLRLPPARRYPAGLVNCVGTAFLDEAVFRGIILGLTLAAGWPVELAVSFQAVLYGLVTRLGGKGRPVGMLILALAVGFVGGWLTINTGGIGAALLAHALTRVGLFIGTGHAGQLRPRAPAEEALEASDVPPPSGWAVVRDETRIYRTED